MFLFFRISAIDVCASASSPFTDEAVGNTLYTFEGKNLFELQVRRPRVLRTKFLESDDSDSAAE